jgi:hypothetical protein
MAAPWLGKMPRSEQKAMRWVCGNAIGMQHKKAAAHNMKKTTFGGHPSTGPGFGSKNAPEPA